MSSNPDSICLIGHSADATYTLNAGIAEPVVRKIVAIGPPRRDTERPLNPADQEYFWMRIDSNTRTLRFFDLYDETAVAVTVATVDRWLRRR